MPQGGTFHPPSFSLPPPPPPPPPPPGVLSTLVSLPSHANVLLLHEQELLQMTTYSVLSAATMIWVLKACQGGGGQ
jgi:hypothetical protein